MTARILSKRNAINRACKIAKGQVNNGEDSGTAYVINDGSGGYEAVTDYELYRGHIQDHEIHAEVVAFHDEETGLTAFIDC